MKTPPGLARFAGHDPWEKEIGIGTGRPCSETAKAIMSGRAARARWLRYQAAARAAPPTAAKGGFPYNSRSVAECDPRRRAEDGCDVSL